MLGEAAAELNAAVEADIASRSWTLDAAVAERAGRWTQRRCRGHGAGAAAVLRAAED